MKSSPTPKEDMNREIITAIIIDGDHYGHVVRTNGYLPTIKLLQPKSTTVDYCCGGDEISTIESEYIEYKACFHGADRKTVLYSKKGESSVIENMFPHNVSFSPYTNRTQLFYGFHDEPIRRKDDETQMTDFDKGFERGIQEGRVMQARVEDNSRLALTPKN